MEGLKSLLAERTRWFWIGVFSGFVFPIFAFMLVNAGQGWLDDREAQELAESYPAADPEDFVSAGEDFAEELARIFQDLPAGEVEATSEFSYRPCEGTQQQASRYHVVLDGTGFEDTSQLQTAIDAVDSRVEDESEWSMVDHEPPGERMGGSEAWFYEWEHEGATIMMELTARELESGPSIRIDVSSECYHVPNPRGSPDFGPEELQ